MIEISSSEHLDEILEQDGLFLLDFYADWCGPCKTMKPVLNELSEEQDVEVLKIDIEKQHQLASHFKIQSIPTFYFVLDGEVEEMLMGACSKQDFEGLITKLLDKE